MNRAEIIVSTKSDSYNSLEKGTPAKLLIDAEFVEITLEDGRSIEFALADIKQAIKIAEVLAE